MYGFSRVQSSTSYLYHMSGGKYAHFNVHCESKKNMPPYIRA